MSIDTWFRLENMVNTKTDIFLNNFNLIASQET